MGKARASHRNKSRISQLGWIRQHGRGLQLSGGDDDCAASGGHIDWPPVPQALRRASRAIATPGGGANPRDCAAAPAALGGKAANKLWRGLQPARSQPGGKFAGTVARQPQLPARRRAAGIFRCEHCASLASHAVAQSRHSAWRDDNARSADGREIERQLVFALLAAMFAVDAAGLDLIQIGRGDVTGYIDAIEA